MRTYLHTIAVFCIFIAELSCGNREKVPLIGSVLDDFDQKAQKYINQATKTGDVMIMRTANQMELLIKNLMIQFDDRYKKAMTDLNDKEREIFGELDKMEKLLKEGMGTVKRTEELLNLDLIQFTNRFNLITKQVPFYVSSINGVTIRQDELRHSVEFVGIGFGYSTNQIKYTLQLEVDGQPVPALNVSQKTDKELEYDIPATFYKKYFKERAASFIPATLKVTKAEMDKKGSVKKSTDFIVEFRLTVLPEYGGMIEWEEVIQTSMPRDTGWYDLAYAVGESSEEHPNVWSQHWDSPEKSRIWKVEFPINPLTKANESCSGSGCGWCSSPEGGGGVSYYTDNGRHVVVRRFCNGPSCNFIHRIFYINYEDKPLIISHDTLHVKLDSLFYITLAEKNTGHEYTIKGRDFLGNRVYADNYSTPQGRLKNSGSGNYAGRYRLNFMVTSKE